MKFQLINPQELKIEAENRDEVRELLNHYKLDPFEYVDEISRGGMVHTHNARGRDNTRWFELEYLTSPEFIAPYIARLQKVTGYAGDVPTIEMSPRDISRYRWPLLHTHIVQGFRLTPDGFYFSGFVQSGDWNGKTAEQRAPVMFSDYCREDVGARKSEQQYIHVGNGGLLRENPNYMRRHAPHAEASNPCVFEALLQWWLVTHANNWQRETMAKALDCHKSVCKTDSLGEWLLREYSGMHTAWDKAPVTFEQFAKGCAN